MQKVVKVIWIIAVAIAALALMWFMFLLINDRTDIGPAGPFILYFIWCPVLVFVAVSIVLLIKNKVPVYITSQSILIMFLVIFSLVFSATLLGEPHYEKLMREIDEQNRQYMEQSRQVTADGKYEYFFYLIGRLTDNPRSHIAIRNLTNNVEKSITIYLNFEGVRAVENLPPSTRLIEISPTDDEHIYKLTTTSQLKDKIETFKVNMETGMSKKID